MRTPHDNHRSSSATWKLNALAPHAPALIALLALASYADAALACSAPRIFDSRIAIGAQASNLTATGSASGTSSSKSLFGKKRSSTTQAAPASIYVGVLDIAGCDVLISGMNAQIAVQASNIAANPGGSIFIGGIKVR